MKQIKTSYGGHRYVISYNADGEPTKVEERDPRDGYLFVVWQAPRQLTNPLIKAIITSAGIGR